jgi:hypothetical protein
VSNTEVARPRQTHPLVMMALGTLLGFVVSSIGFTDYGELLKMLTFESLRMFLAFCGAVAISIVGYRVLAKSRPLAPRRFHSGVIAGGVLFGVGWAVSGACPGAALAQLGQGKLWALAILAGIAIGNVGFQQFNARVLHIQKDSCS